MYSHCTIFNGNMTIKEQDSFYRFFNKEIVPIIKTIPVLHDLKVFRPCLEDKGECGILLKLEMTFKSIEDLGFSLDSVEYAEYINTVVEFGNIGFDNIAHSNFRVCYDYQNILDI